MLDQYQLEAQEEITCARRVSLHGRSYLAVGTVVFSEEDGSFEEDEEYGIISTGGGAGRVLLFDPRINSTTKTWELGLESSINGLLLAVPTDGRVHDVEVVNDYLAIANANQVSGRVRACHIGRNWTDAADYNIAIRPCPRPFHRNG